MSDTVTFSDLVAPAEVGPSTNGKEPCPECGKLYVPGAGMGVHRASAHGTLNKTTRHGRPRRECPECGKWFSSRDMARHMRRHGIEPVKKPSKPRPVALDWDVDDIFTVVVQQLWPGGVIPTQAVIALVKWREATQEMLEAIR
jgi:endogenous inhibitor of DNA gyrase (YacG/DUF329 family)